MEAEDRTIPDVLLAPRPGVDAAPVYAVLSETLRTLTQRAQEVGAMRADVSAADALTAVCAVAKALPPPRPDQPPPPETPGAAAAADPTAWRRLVRVIIDSMRAAAEAPREATGGAPHPLRPARAGPTPG